MVERDGTTAPGQHRAVSLAKILLRHRVVVAQAQLDPGVITRAHMEWADSAQEAVERELERRGPGAKALFVCHSHRLVPAQRPATGTLTVEGKPLDAGAGGCGRTARGLVRCPRPGSAVAAKGARRLRGFGLGVHVAADPGGDGDTLLASFHEPLSHAFGPRGPPRMRC